MTEASAHRWTNDEESEGEELQATRVSAMQAVEMDEQHDHLCQFIRLQVSGIVTNASKRKFGISNRVPLPHHYSARHFASVLLSTAHPQLSTAHILH